MGNSAVEMAAQCCTMSAAAIQAQISYRGIREVSVIKPLTDIKTQVFRVSLVLIGEGVVVSVEVLGC
jgi:hypothetical protein